MRSRVVAGALALAALTSVAACSSGSTTGRPAGAAQSAADSSAPAGVGAGSAASASAGKSVDICKVLNVATAARLSGQPYSTATPETGDFAASCAYNNDDATAQGVNVTLETTDHARADSTWNFAHTGSVTDISGVGDKAFWDNDNTLYTQSGADLIQVNGLSDQNKSVALAKVVLAALR